MPEKLYYAIQNNIPKATNSRQLLYIFLSFALTI